MHVILEEGLQDDDYIARNCEDFESVREVVSRYTPEDAERVTGVSAEAIRATAREYATSGTRRSSTRSGSPSTPAASTTSGRSPTSS
jgi:anaerobic selenocysteine-containing dehydrogenase